MGRALLLLSFVGAAALVAWVVLDRSEGDSKALESLHDARSAARTARYLDVRTTSCCDRDGRRLSQRMQFAPVQYVYSLNGRLTGWQKRQVSYGLREDRGCYERRVENDPLVLLEWRHTLREMRRDIVVPRAFVHEAELVESGGRTLIRWRGPIGERGNRVSGTLRLDRAGRAVLKRERLTVGGRRTGHSTVWRYHYPTTNDLGRAPGPRCRHSGGAP